MIVNRLFKLPMINRKKMDDYFITASARNRVSLKRDVSTAWEYTAAVPQRNWESPGCSRDSQLQYGGNVLKDDPEMDRC